MQFRSSGELCSALYPVGFSTLYDLRIPVTPAQVYSRVESNLFMFMDYRRVRVCLSDIRDAATYYAYRHMVVPDMITRLRLTTCGQWTDESLRNVYSRFKSVTQHEWTGRIQSIPTLRGLNHELFGYLERLCYRVNNSRLEVDAMLVYTLTRITTYILLSSQAIRMAGRKP